MKEMKDIKGREERGGDSTDLPRGLQRTCSRQ